MLSERTACQAVELRRLLDAGTLDHAGPVDVRPGCPLPASLAVRIVLADLLHLMRAGARSPTQWGMLEEQIQWVHQAIVH